jgi:hypothetical protein
VIERLVDNWLTSTPERPFQLAFCQLLASRGFRVIYISRHGPFEQGKDVIAIAPSGEVHAYQLKVGTLRLKQWRDTVWPECEELLDLPVKHPSVAEGTPHTSHLVVSGTIADEVSIQIIDRNRKRAAGGLPTLLVVSGGDLLPEFLAAHGKYLPGRLEDVSLLFSLYVADGRGLLDKEKLSAFLASVLKLEEADMSTTDAREAIASALVFTAYLVRPYATAENHCAEAEAWVLALAHILAFAEKHELRAPLWRDAVALATDGADTAVARLYGEVVGRDDFLMDGADGGLLDSPLCRVRACVVGGWVAAGIVSRALCGAAPFDNGDPTRLVAKCREDLEIWGESAVPHLVAMYWALALAGDPVAVPALERALNSVVFGAFTEDGIASPYYGPDESIRLALGMTKRPIVESFAGTSFAARGLVLLLAAAGRRDAVQALWPRLTRIVCREYEPNPAWEWCLWRSPNGTLWDRAVADRNSWEVVKREAAALVATPLPAPLADCVHLLPLLLVAYPHRFIVRARSAPAGGPPDGVRSARHATG